MFKKLNNIIESRKYKLATVKNGNTLIYVDNLKSWEKDTKFGEYDESEDASYNITPIIIKSSDINVSDDYYCTGRNYGLYSILRDCFDNNKQIGVGSTIGDLFDFVEDIRGICELYIPFSCTEDTSVLDRDDLKLCYIEEGVAYFTNNPNPWGDDWNDSPYQYNAGEPYKEDSYEVVMIGFNAKGYYSEPCEYFHSQHFSVEEINCKFIPWLIPEDVKNPPIFAGETIKGFTKKIKNVSGDILYRIK